MAVSTRTFSKLGPKYLAMLTAVSALSTVKPPARHAEGRAAKGLVLPPLLARAHLPCLVLFCAPLDGQSRSGMTDYISTGPTARSPEPPAPLIPFPPPPLRFNHPLKPCCRAERERSSEEHKQNSGRRIGFAFRPPRLYRPSRRAAYNVGADH